MKHVALLSFLCLSVCAHAHVFDSADCGGIANVAYTISSEFHEDGSQANYVRILRLVDQSIEKSIGDPSSFIVDKTDAARLRTVADMAYEHRDDMTAEKFADAIVAVCIKHSKDHDS